MRKRVAVVAGGAAAVLALLAVGLTACRPREPRPPQRDDKAGKPWPAPQVDVSLVAVPAAYTGAGPARIRFVGAIRVDGPCGVQYTFGRSDGATVPVKFVRFRGPGKQAVEFTWQVSKDYTGWVTLHALSPREVESNKANFTVKITGPH